MFVGRTVASLDLYMNGANDAEVMLAPVWLCVRVHVFADCAALLYAERGFEAKPCCVVHEISRSDSQEYRR